MGVKKYSLLAMSLLMGQLVHGRALIVEYAGNIENHTQNIEDILCTHNIACDSLTMTEFWGAPYEALERGVLLYRPSVVNFSFAIQQGTKPQGGRAESLEDFQKRLEEYEKGEISFQKEVSSLNSLIKKAPGTLFAVAAGNGVRITVVQSQGVALGENNIIYPANIQAPNAITVAALNSDKIDLTNPESILVADYSNYGLTTVDVLAPVLKNKKGETLRGSSYAAPYIARLGHQIADLGKLSPSEIKEILIKSSYVKNIDAAIAASQDLIQNGSKSLTYKAMYTSKRAQRIALQKQLGDIILVRSGGPVVEEVALLCAQHYLRTEKAQDITQSCLQAHQDMLGDLANPVDKLRLLWELREI